MFKGTVSVMSNVPVYANITIYNGTFKIKNVEDTVLFLTRKVFNFLPWFLYARNAQVYEPVYENK